MSTQNNKRKLDDAYGPTFDPGLDVATVVFSHVRCVKTRVNLAWSASCGGTPPSLPLRTLAGSTPARSRTCILGRGVLVSYACWTTTKLCLCPTRESLDFLVKLRKFVCDFAAAGGV